MGKGILIRIKICHYDCHYETIAYTDDTQAICVCEFQHIAFASNCSREVDICPNTLFYALLGLLFK